jgi:thiosulfate dehydrogenase
MVRALILFSAAWILAASIVPARAQTDSTAFFSLPDSLRSGPLVSAKTAMETAWDLVRNPLADTIPGDPVRAALVREGFRMFIQTKRYAARFTANDLSCGHCHVNAGQREKALPVVGISTVFPEYNKRSVREFTLADRITGCFLRSMNGSAAPAMLAAHDPVAAEAEVARSREVRAISAYIDWLSEGYAPGDSLPWRGLNTIGEDSLLAVDRLDSARGAGIFMERCSNCHGEDGQGVAIGDIRAGPLWGPASWNDGAGAARVYTLAGMIRHMMPFIDPGSLTDEEAQHVAYFICLQPRPVYPFKSEDYRDGKIPPDALAYKKGP